MNPVRGIETSRVLILPFSTLAFKLMNPVRGIETTGERKMGYEKVAFKLMNPVRGIETHYRLTPRRDQIFQINESRSRD